MEKPWLANNTLTVWLTLFFEILRYTYERYTLTTKYPERNIRGFIAIVTGANSGIGKTTAFELAKRGATVILGCRNLTEGRKTIDEFQKKMSAAKFDLIELDLADLASVRRFAATVKSKYSKVDILVNNAGIFDTSGIWKATADGFESHFGTNYLGHFLLTNLLLDHLKSGTSSRVINVSSTLQIFARPFLKLNDLMLKNRSDWSFFNALPYTLSKYANSLFAKELSRRLEGSGVVSCSLCPGYVETGIFRGSNWINRVIVYITTQILGLSAEQGCATTVYLATASKAPDAGQFYRLNKLHSGVNNNLPSSLATDLWRESAKLVQIE